ncbi:MAG: hypothetical protein WC505_04195 [Patescibacteria group bacterium]
MHNQSTKRQPLRWANFFHVYQPPNWSPAIVRKVARESYRPLCAILTKNPRIKITLNVTGSLTEQLAECGQADIIGRIARLAKRKQIELTGSAQYHPILPLIPAHEIRRQVKLNARVNRLHFGPVYRPRGFFPPEMAYGGKIAPVIEKLGYRWLIADEISKNGTLSTTLFNARYRIKNTQLNIVFRNRVISDYFSFHGNPKRLESFWETIRQDSRSGTALITAMDGENLGHHRKGWDSYWKRLVTSHNIRTVTMSELLHTYTKNEVISPRKASWSTQEREMRRGNPYVLWNDPHNDIHKNQWELLRRVTALIERHKAHENYATARELLDRRYASDQFWWASAKPWWSLEIISKKTGELLSAADLVSPRDPQAVKLASTIISLARTWQQKMTFRSTADSYLATNEGAAVRFLGGKKISA